MATYRVNVQSSEAAANGDVYLDCWIQRFDDPDWVNVESGHRTMVLDGAAVLAVTEQPTWTDTQKRNALLEIFRQEALSWGVDEADDANTQLVALLPSGWPVNVNLET